jgi:adenylate cyclase
MFVLTVRHHGGSQQYQLSEGRTVVGRSPQCDVVINDDSISRQHARLAVGPGQVELTDLQSRNGTYLAGEPVRDAILRGGERLSFGDVEALLEKRVDEPTMMTSTPSGATEHTMIRRLGEPAAAVTARVVEAPRLINLLGEIARTLVATLQTSEILNKVIDLLLAHVPAERACLLLADATTKEFTSQIVRRQDGKPAQPVEISRTVREMTLRQRVAVLTSDVKQDSRFDGSQSVLLSDVRSLICGPLYAGDELIGLLYVDNPVTRQFSEADLELFSAIANYSAVAITQGRLAERLRDESERRERLQRYHSPAVVERIMAKQNSNGDDVLAAHDRDISVLFADVVGFTALAETLAPSEVSALLNRFFSEMTEAIFAEEGTVDKFIGDAILAVFGAPVDQPDHARRAVRAAQAMRRAVARLNAAGGRVLRVRYAINSGVAIAGDVGSARRREYTVLGDVVNTASRLEALAEPDQILVSRATYDRLQPPVAATPLGEREIRGRTGRVEILSIDPD